MSETCTIVRRVSSTKVRTAHHSSSKQYYRIGMQRPKPKETLAKNLKMLMDETGIKVSALSKSSGVSVRMILYILKEEKTATIDTANDLAAVFRLDGWSLLMPDLRADLMKNGRLTKLVKNYLTASQQGREYIDHVAEKEADYNKA